MLRFNGRPHHPALHLSLIPVCAFEKVLGVSKLAFIGVFDTYDMLESNTKTLSLQQDLGFLGLGSLICGNSHCQDILIENPYYQVQIIQLLFF